MRQIDIGSTYYTYDTWGLTLTSYSFSPPVYKKNFVSVPGRDGDLDLSTALTDGEPRYESRTFTATFEISTGTRATREELFREILNTIDGRDTFIRTPDDSKRVIFGRLSVEIKYNDNAHGALTITGICQPWRFSSPAKTQTLTASSTPQTATLTNAGRLLVTPTLVVSGTKASVTLTFGGSTWTLAAGTYVLPDLVLLPGDNTIEYSGSGKLKFTWRDGVL